MTAIGKHRKKLDTAKNLISVKIPFNLLSMQQNYHNNK